MVHGNEAQTEKPQLAAKQTHDMRSSRVLSRDYIHQSSILRVAVELYISLELFANAFSLRV